MSPGSLDSGFDLDRFQARIQHTDREPSPDARAGGRADTDFAAVGATFWDQIESYPRHNSLDLSEGEEIAQDPLHAAMQAGLMSDIDSVLAGNRLPSRSPSTPTPTQPHRNPYTQPPDIAHIRGQRGQHPRRAHRRHRGMFALYRFVILLVPGGSFTPSIRDYH